MELRIRYTGLEALPSSIHTKAQFLHIMNNVITLHPIVVQLIKGGMKYFHGYRLPGGFKRFTLEDWMEFAGATHVIY